MVGSQHCPSPRKANAMAITIAPSPPLDTVASSNGPAALSDSPLLPQNDAAAVPDEILTRVVKGAHDTIDRLAEQAAPQLQLLQEGVAGASGTLQDQAHRLRETGDEWAESLRGTVRVNPLAALATGLAMGLLIARVTR